MALPALAAPAEEPARIDVIDTDRPGLVESPEVMAKGRLEIEGGFQVERSRVAGAKQRLSTTPLLLRVGVGEDLELRLESAGRTKSRADREVRGYSDLAIGIKWHLQDAGRGQPALGALLHLNLPTGTSEFRNEGAQPSLRLVAQWELQKDVWFGIMPGLSYENDENRRRFVNGIVGISLTKELAERLKGYVEIAAPQIARSRHGGSIVTYGTGAAYLLSNSTQIDAAVNVAANKNSPDYIWTVGLARKF